MAMRSRHSSHSASRSSTEALTAPALVAVLVAGLAASACGGDGGTDCGPGGAPADGVTVTAGAGAGGGESESATFGQFSSSPNNDCPPPGGDGPTSLTVQGGQVDPADPARFLVLCLPRPDRIGAAPIALDDAELVQVVDLVAAPADGCRLTLDRDRGLTGQVTFSGFCDDGTSPDGYAVAFDATIPLLRVCPAGDAGPGDPGGGAAVEAQLGGRAAVTAAGG